MAIAFTLAALFARSGDVHRNYDIEHLHDHILCLCKHINIDPQSKDTSTDLHSLMLILKYDQIKCPLHRRSSAIALAALLKADCGYSDKIKICASLSYIGHESKVTIPLIQAYLLELEAQDRLNPNINDGTNIKNDRHAIIKSYIDVILMSTPD